LSASAPSLSRAAALDFSPLRGFVERRLAETLGLVPPSLAPRTRVGAPAAGGGAGAGAGGGAGAPAAGAGARALLVSGVYCYSSLPTGGAGEAWSVARAAADEGFSLRNFELDEAAGGASSASAAGAAASPALHIAMAVDMLHACTLRGGGAGGVDAGGSLSGAAAGPPRRVDELTRASGQLWASSPAAATHVLVAAVGTGALVPCFARALQHGRTVAVAAMREDWARLALTMPPEQREVVLPLLLDDVLPELVLSADAFRASALPAAELAARLHRLLLSLPPAAGGEAAAVSPAADGAFVSLPAASAAAARAPGELLKHMRRAGATWRSLAADFPHLFALQAAPQAAAAGGGGGSSASRSAAYEVKALPLPAPHVLPAAGAAGAPPASTPAAASVPRSAPPPLRGAERQRFQRGAQPPPQPSAPAPRPQARPPALQAPAQQQQPQKLSPATPRPAQVPVAAASVADVEQRAWVVVTPLDEPSAVVVPAPEQQPIVVAVAATPSSSLTSQLPAAAPAAPPAAVPPAAAPPAAAPPAAAPPAAMPTAGALPAAALPAAVSPPSASRVLALLRLAADRGIAPGAGAQRQNVSAALAAAGVVAPRGAKLADLCALLDLRADAVESALLAAPPRPAAERAPAPAAAAASAASAPASVPGDEAQLLSLAVARGLIASADAKRAHLIALLLAAEVKLPKGGSSGATLPALRAAVAAHASVVREALSLGDRST